VAPVVPAGAAGYGGAGAAPAGSTVAAVPSRPILPALRASGGSAVSLFYVLPPRPAVGDALARFLNAVLPGLDWDAAGRRGLGELVAGLAAWRPGVFVIHREDLPVGETLGRALVDACGAEAGDEVVEVRPAARAGEWSAQRWTLG
jgi:hypothetical protein